MKRIAVLGSTGSIGRQTLDVVAAHKDEFKLVAISFGANTDVGGAQIMDFRPAYIGVSDPAAAKRIKTTMPAGATLFCGADAACRIAAETDADIVVNGISGFYGTLPLIAALEAGKTVALANKESIVCGYPLVSAALAASGGRIIPVDSEQSALFQCLQAGKSSEISRLILTASGGPFFGRSRNQLADVMPAEALRHPTWSMGRAITLDSATMFNKGLEIIEAARLFNVTGDRIDVLIHPQSVVHSMVEFIDGQVMAQLAIPDMRGAIQYALSYPDRITSVIEPLNLAKKGHLDFFEPDREAFPAIDLAYRALDEGMILPIAYNAAKETASEAYLASRIGFNDIGDCVTAVMDAVCGGSVSTIKELLAADETARNLAKSYLGK